MTTCKHFHSSLIPFTLAVVAALNGAGILHAQQGYQKPPQAILDVMHAPEFPHPLPSPTGDSLLLIRKERYPAVAELAAPYLKLAGLRIDPATNGPHAPPRIVGLALVSIADGRRLDVRLPPSPRLSMPLWSPDGKRFAFMHTTAAGIELWIGQAQTGQVRKFPGLRINAAYGVPVQWLPGGKSLLCQAVPTGRGQPPVARAVPAGPTIQESQAKPGPIPTFQDLLQNAHDEDLFDYLAASQLVVLDPDAESPLPVSRPAVFRSATPSPDGRFLLVKINHRPYSYLVPAASFPADLEVWDRQGKLVRRLARLPLADQVPMEGVPTGPRHCNWQPTAPATLVWVEALDGGDPRRRADHRDRVLVLSFPFEAKPRQLARTPERFKGVTWGEKGGLALVRDYNRDRRWQVTTLYSSENLDGPGRVIWSRSIHDKYKDPGEPVLRTLPSGQRVFRMHHGAIFLIGKGATPAGERPFLDRMDLETLKTERLFHSAEGTYETVSAVLGDEGFPIITSHESPDEPPNLCLRTQSGRKQALTKIPNPTPQLSGITRQLVTYKRDDGVPLSFTLYLPPGYKKGERLPALLWAYPREFVDGGTAGQVSGSPYRFLAPQGPSHLLLLLQGYAILDGASMPVVGDPETVNNSYVEQIVSSARAAIQKADAMGVIDPGRVAVGGHSYGAFMTANLLAHSNLFKAGIARSGAYNRTLTPFGFQTERRTLWEAPELYVKVSPFLHADRIKTPLLLIHGTDDNNQGTFPIQSERMYQAIKGNGGTVRFVSLPHESHGYLARESVEHTVQEMIAWLDRFLRRP
jgi:dipeptidyl aminopeptidase/acylaminoacyl peptidase